MGYTNDNVEINIGELVKIILKHWKLAILCIAIFSVIFGIVGYNINIQEMSTNKLSIKEKKQILALSIGDAEIIELEEQAKIIKTYKNMYKDQIEYAYNSLLMKIDPTQVNIVTLVYAIENQENIGNDTKEIILLAYKNKLKDISILEEIKKKSNMQCETNYLTEVIKINDENMIESKYLTIEIIGNDETTAKSLSNAIKQVLVDQYEEVSSVLGEHQLKMQNETFSIEADYQILNFQEKHMKDILSSRDNINAMQSKNLGDSKNYLSLLLGENQIENAEMKVNKLYVIKFIFFGTLLGISTYTFFNLLIYFCSDKIRGTEIVKKYFKLKVFGTITSSDLLDRNLTKEENLEMIRNAISLDAKMQGIDEFLIYSSSLTVKEMEMLSKLQQQLKDDNIQIIIPDIQSNEQFLNEFFRIKDIIMILRISQNTVKETQKNLDELALHHKNVLGIIMLEARIRNTNN